MTPWALLLAASATALLPPSCTKRLPLPQRSPSASRVPRPRIAAAGRRDVRAFSGGGDGEVDPLEVRLDVTVLWCHCLARELSYELSHNPLKAVPGFTPADLSALGCCAAATTLLSLAWVGAGLATRQFAGVGDTAEGLWRTLATTVVAAPLWLSFEVLISSPLARDASAAHYASSGLGLAASMCLVRLLR